MRLTKKQKQGIEAFFSKRGTLPNECPICRKRAWVFTDGIFKLPELIGEKGMKLKESQVIPIFTVMCRNCGHTLLFNAIQLGILERTPKKQTLTRKTQKETDE